MKRRKVTSDANTKGLIKKIFYVVIFIFCNEFAFAQQYKFSKLIVSYQIPELASISPLTEIMEDHLGFIWIGTQNGLYKFDGYTTVHYQFDPNSPEKIAGNWISGLIEDDSGNIWMGIFGVGLQKLNPLTEKFTLYKPDPANSESLCNNRVNEVLIYKNKLWIDTQGGTCTFSFNTGKFKTYSKGYYEQTMIKNDRELWHLNCTSDYLTLCSHQTDGDKFVGNDTLHIKATVCQPIAFLQDQLFLNIDGTVYIYNTRSKVLSPISTGSGDPVTATLYSKGHIFILTTSGKFETYDIEKNSLDIQQGYLQGATKLIKLRNGDLWVLANSIYKTRSDEPGVLTYSLIVDSKYADFGAQSLLSEWQPGLLGIGGGTQLDFDHVVAVNSSSRDPSFKPFDSTSTIDKDVNIYVDENKDSWIALFNRPTGEMSFFKFSNLNKQLIKLGSMHEGHPLFGITKIGNDIWVATWMGMIKWNVTLSKGEIIDKGEDSAKLIPKSIRYCFKDRDDDLWVATQNGLYLKEENKKDFVLFTSRPGDTTALSFNSANCIAQDSSGMIWIGTWGGGINKYDKKTGKFSWLTTKQGLAQDNIDNLIVDKKNNIWISYAAGGIARIDPATNKVLSFTLADGAFGYGQNSSTTMSDGSLVFGTSGVLTRIIPDKIKDNKFVPSIFITDFKLFNQSVSVNGADSILHTNINVARSITLDHDQNVFTLEYAALDMLFPGQRKYAYQLEGFDNGWQYVDSKREVTYTNLSPGHYTFKVKSVDRYGQWNEIKDPLRINILPPWWKTWWAYTLYALLFILAIRAFVLYRSASLKKQNLVLENKVVDRTDQLKRSLEELKSTQSQLIQSEKMASLGELTAGIAHEIQNPLNFVNNFSDVNQELLTEMKDEMDKGNISEARSIADDVIENEGKINHHGKRADAIVKGMLQHSRSSTGVKELTDINKLTDEYLRLSYHGLRAKDNSFNAIMKTEFDETIGKIKIIPQDIGRVLLNLYNNAFYAVNEKQNAERSKQNAEYHPTVSVQTKKINDTIILTVMDNGNGIPQKVVDKIFQPFFTTKPTGQGTGLGLSLSYDIIKAHGGEIKVETKEGEGTKFIIQLPNV